MNKKIFNFLSFMSVFIIASVLSDMSFAAQAAGPRSGTVVTTSVTPVASETLTPLARADGRDIKKTTDAPDGDNVVSRTATRRTSTARTPTNTVQGVTGRNATRQNVVTTTPSVVSRAGTSASVSRAATSSAVSRSARPSTVGATVARSGSIQTVADTSRVNQSRAAAVFDDVSKIGGGYAKCRDAYNTCMDQFCAKANDTYRRCYCSSKFTEFRETEAALSEAKTLLMRFEDNNLNAVDKTSAEVTAMYNATVGEKAIKDDPSAAQEALSQIGDLLSGKKKAQPNTLSSMGLFSLDFTADIGDIWGGGGNDIFSAGGVSDLSKLEANALYTAADKQCVALIKESCENNAVFTMAKSSYNVLITQDCNTYEKKIDKDRLAVTDVVRQAEKMLRDARLDEYRSHNSADVNECITKVKTAITGEMACGKSYKKCLDYTGLYIDTNTGDPIYSPQLFELSSLLNLNNSVGNVINTNPRFNKFLDDKKMFAETALDTCRDKAVIVWEEFKRSALIEIAQAQDAKIEEVKSSCVDIISECYDTQSGGLAEFAGARGATSTGALNVYTARAMCADKVTACAALYPGPKCEFDNNGRLRSNDCGLKSLLAFVQTVDNVKIAEGCQVSINNYVTTLCTPDDKTQKYPYKCRMLARAELQSLIESHASTYCADPATGTYDIALVGDAIKKIMNDVESAVDAQLDAACEEAEGAWVDAEDARGAKKEVKFYSNVYGKSAPADAEGNTAERGYCILNTIAYQCMAQDDATGGKGYAKYNASSNTCVFTTEWYKIQCERIGGYWEGSACSK